MLKYGVARQQVYVSSKVALSQETLLLKLVFQACHVL